MCVWRVHRVPSPNLVTGPVLSAPMLHPVGHLPPSVYWRRRLSLLASVVVLVALTAYVLRPGSGGSKPTAATTPASSTSSAAVDAFSTVLPSPTPDASASGSHSRHASGSASAGATTTRSTHSAADTTPSRCDVAKLGIAAVVQDSSYQVGDQPVVMAQVTNPGPTPCVQDLSDRQIELRIYNGESRVWGSHDCQVVPGTAERTLRAKQTVRVSITWSGLSSQPGCAGTRQRVGAGTYTLYALVGGREGAAAQFSMN